MTKDETIRQLRDAAVSLLKLRGQWCSNLGIETLDARVGGIDISLRPAFDTAYSHGLDIWAPNKVLNIEWDEARRRLMTVSFGRGNWEQLLLSAAQQTVAPSLQ